MPQLSLSSLLLALVLLVGAAGASSVIMSTLLTPTDMRIEPLRGTSVVGKTFTINIVVASDEPVNVFQGELQFDPNILSVASIDYNTSIADLWAELPWYSNGDGTLNFIGGTTQPGGFIGTDTLITITFSTKAPGEAIVFMEEARVLKHDGLGTDAQLAAPIDAIFNVDEVTLAKETKLQKTALGPKLVVLPQPPSTDLNDDGKQSLLDVSIFMTHLATQNKRADFNLDGAVTTADLSILMSAQ